MLLAEDGAAALQALEAETPDLLITDVEMPEVDGFELTRRVRAHPRYSRLPVIMITSSDERHRPEANAAGVNLLLGKPYAEETLLAQVQVMLAAAATQRKYRGHPRYDCRLLQRLPHALLLADRPSDPPTQCTAMTAPASGRRR